MSLICREGLEEKLPYTAEYTGEEVAAAVMPRLALVARLYAGVESRNCQSSSAICDQA